MKALKRGRSSVADIYVRSDREGGTGQERCDNDSRLDFHLIINLITLVLIVYLKSIARYSTLVCQNHYSHSGYQHIN